MWEKINNFLKGQIVTSIIYVALGACLAFMPVNMINVICKFIFGILLILVGCYHILLYILEKLNATILDLFSGGVFLWLRSERIVHGKTPAGSSIPVGNYKNCRI